MSYDYSYLNGIIVQKFGTQSKFANEIGLSEESVSKKLNNKVPWKQNQIERACAVLGIAEKEIPKYFFKLKVQ